MSFDSILDSARKAAEIIQRVADKLKITLPKDFPDQIVQLNNCLDVYSASKTMIAAVVSDARGGFNVESMAKLTANFDTNWDAFAKEYNELFNKSTAEQQTNVLETFARTHFGDNVFTAGSIIKNETPAILGGIVTFKAGINSFKGSYRNPEEAVNKIKTGIDSITAATEKIAGSLNNIAKTIQGGDGATGVALLEKLSKLHEIKLLNVTSNALGVAQHGMAAYGSGKAALGSSMAALGDVKDLLGDIKKGDLKGAISSGKATVDSVKDAIDDVKDTIKSGKKTIESAKATLSGLKGNVSDGQLTGAAANISGTSGASRMAGSRGNAATSRSADTANQGGQDKQDESGKSDSYVCSGATMQCTFGDKKAKLTVYPDRTVFLTGQPMANISDHQSMYNIAGFGKCHTTRYPSTGAATAANHGKLTPMPCVPGTNTEWKNGKDDYIIKGDAALLKSSYCKCRWGGIITITDDGQKDTGAADMSRVAAISMEQMLTETEEKQGLNPEAVLDGIQLALDAAGFIPGLGAIPDLTNAAISALRGNWLEAGMSVLAAVPIIGDAAAGAKLASKGMKIAKGVDKTRKAVLAKEAKNYISREITGKELLKTGICKSEKEVEFFQKALRGERKNFAENFYKRKGMTEKKQIVSHVNGIDLNHAVKVKEMPPPKELIRFNEPGMETGGSYFGISSRTGNKINTPRSYGIQPVVVKKGTVVRKKKTVYKISEDAQPFEYLESTARPIKAPLDNNWSSAKNVDSGIRNVKTGKMRKNWTDTKGGAIQAYIPFESRNNIIP